MNFLMAAIGHHKPVPMAIGHRQWCCQPDNLVMLCKYRPRKQSISKEMNNDDLKFA